MIKTIRIVLFSLLVAILASCTSTKKVKTVEEILPPNRLVKRLEANRRKIKTFEGSGVMKIETPKINAKASFEVFVKKPDSIKLSIYGPFGIDIAQAVVTNSEFEFHDVLRNTVYKGRTDNNLLKKVFHIDLSFSELIDAFAGAVNLTSKLRGTPSNYKLEDDNYILTYTDTNSTKKSIYEIKTSNLAIGNYKLFASRNNLLFEGDYSKFKLYNKVAIPRKTTVENKRQNQKVEIEYRSVTVNEKLESLKIEIPTDAKVIEW
ncbi:MAG: DUF4292 domain-containing protein [Melioribacteraceae bacterium]